MMELEARPPFDPSDFDALRPDRCSELFLYLKDSNQNSDHEDQAVDQPAEESQGMVHKQGSTPSSYRYKICVVDRNIPVHKTAVHTTTASTSSSSSTRATFSLDYATAVFLIPAGREGEYMFSSDRGLRSIAESAKTARLLCVSFGRQHVFENQDAVKQELSETAISLSRNGSFLAPSQVATLKINPSEIPFFAIDGIGDRNVIAQGTSTLSGQYIVEQVQTDESNAGDTKRFVRRLYFLDNPFVIQSEVALIPNKSKKCTRKGRTTSGEAIGSRKAWIDIKDDMVVDKSCAAFDYHKTLVAGVLALVPTSISAASRELLNGENHSIESGMMIGLGGGALVNLLHSLISPTSINLTVIELDPAMVDIAINYFGLDVTPQLSIKIGNGLDVVCSNGEDTDSGKPELSFPPGSISFVIVDVDSKDKTVGMSCPPMEFVETAYLERIADILCPQSGMLAINVSARDPAMLQLVCYNVSAVFPTVFLSADPNKHASDEKEERDESEDLNVVLFALRSSSAIPSKIEIQRRLDRVLSDMTPSGNGGVEYDIVMSNLTTSLETLNLWRPSEGHDNNHHEKDGKRKPKRKKGGKRHK